MSKKTLVIFAYPSHKESVINKPIKDALKNEQNIIYKDLTEDYGDGDIDIKKEQEDLLSVDKIVFQFPLFWGSAPYILKKWIDSMYTHGFALKTNEQGEIEPLALKGKEFQIVVSTGGSKEFYNDANKISIRECLATYSYTAKMLGMKVLEPITLHGIEPNKFSQDEISSMVDYVKKSI